MFRALSGNGLARLWDVLSAVGAAAYFLGFLAVIGIALRKLAY